MSDTPPLPEMPSPARWGAPPPPPPAGMPPPPPPGWAVSATGWYSLRGLTTALTILLWVEIGASVLFAAALVNRISISNEVIDGSFGSDLGQRANDADGFVGLAVLLWLGLFVAIAVLTIIWTWRALKNHERLGRYETSWTPGWGIAGWLIPLANLVIPVLIFQTLWRGSDVDAGRNNVERPSGSALVGWWWATWLLSGAVNRFSTGTSDTLDARELRDADTITAIGSAITVVAALLFISVLRRITERQERYLAGTSAALSAGEVATRENTGVGRSPLPPTARVPAGTAMARQPSTPPAPPEGAPGARRRVWVAGAVGVALILVGAGIAALLLSPDGGDEAATKRSSSTVPSAPPSTEPLLAAPTDLVLYVVPGSCSEAECRVGARLRNNSGEATKFRFYLEDGAPVGPGVAPPIPATPGAVVDLGPPGVPAPVGIRFCVYVVAIDAGGNHSGHSNTVCFTLNPTSEGDLNTAADQEGRQPDQGLSLEAALTEVPGYRVEDAPIGVVDAFRQALLASNDLGANEDIVAVKHYLRDDGTDAYAYLVSGPGVQLRRPVSGGCSIAPSGDVITLAGQDVCRQQFDNQWILSWGGDFTLRVLSNSPATAEHLMTALLAANATAEEPLLRGEVEEVVIKKAGVSLSLPSDWKRSARPPQPKPTDDCEVGIVGQPAPAESGLSSSTLLFAGTDNDDDGYADAVVSVDFAKDIRFLEAPAGIQTSLLAAGWRDVVVRRSQLARKPAIKATATTTIQRNDCSTQEVHARIYEVIVPRGGVLITLNSDLADSKRYRATLDAIVHSVRIQR